jgi:hypothetical protein
MTKDSVAPTPGGQARSTNPLFDTPAGHCWYCRKPIDRSRTSRRRWKFLPGANMTHLDCEMIRGASPEGSLPTRNEHTDDGDFNPYDYFDALEEWVWHEHPCRRPPAQIADPALISRLQVRIEIVYAHAVQDLTAADNPYRLDGEDFGDYLGRRIIDAPDPWRNPKEGFEPLDDDDDEETTS